MCNILIINDENQLDKIAEGLKESKLNDKIFVISSEMNVNSISEAIDVILTINDNDYGKIVGLICKMGWKNFKFQSADIEDDKGNTLKTLLCLNERAYSSFNDFSVFTRKVTVNTFIEYFKSKSVSEDVLSNLKSFMTSIGIYSNNLGYSYVLDAFILAFNDRNRLNKITSSLYPVIGELRGKSGKCVERDIRSVIELSCNSGKFYTAANSIGGNFEQNEKPSNGEFIAFLVDVFSTKKY